MSKKITKQKNGFTQRLQTAYADLRKSEKKIADYLLQHSRERLDLSITDFAKRLKVSETTVSRFCRVVGYQGFQDLKLSMATALQPAESFENIPPEIAEGDPTPVIGQKLSQALANAIANTQQSLDIQSVDRAIEAIAGAKQVMLYGIGGSAVVAGAAHHLFTKAGLNCVIYTDGYMQTVSASMLQPRSVVIGVSNTGLTKHVVDAMDIAADRGATTIGITSEPDSAIAKAVSICLVTPVDIRDTPLYGGAINAKVCQLFIVDLLYLGVLFKLGRPLKRNLKETATALRTYYNPIGR